MAKSIFCGALVAFLCFSQALAVPLNRNSLICNQGFRPNTAFTACIRDNLQFNEQSFSTDQFQPVISTIRGVQDVVQKMPTLFAPQSLSQRDAQFDIQGSTQYSQQSFQQTPQQFSQQSIQQQDSQQFNQEQPQFSQQSFQQTPQQFSQHSFQQQDQQTVDFHPQQFGDGGCEQGFTLSFGECVDIDECEINNGGCDQLCHNFQGGSTCSCNQPGYLLSGVDHRACVPLSSLPEGQAPPASGPPPPASVQPGACPAGYTMNLFDSACEDVNECDDFSHDCSQECHNVPGSFFCRCFPGFELSTEDFKTCVEERSTSPPSFGNSPPCGNGFVQVGNECQDVDECEFNNGDCEQQCHNFEGGRACSCGSGYLLNGLDQRTCVPNFQSPMPDFQAPVFQAPVSVNVLSNICEPGFAHTPSGECVDINECEINNGGCDQQCHNFEGGRACACDQPGMVLSGLDHSSCVPENSLPFGQPIPSESGDCLAPPCMEGLQQVGNCCQDVDECGANNGGCDQNCFNHFGGYTCGCNDGYLLSGFDHTTCLQQ